VCHARGSKPLKYENRHGHQASRTHVLVERPVENLASTLSPESTHWVAHDAELIEVIRHPTTQPPYMVE